jgi:hypothetical protein
VKKGRVSNNCLTLINSDRAVQTVSLSANAVQTVSVARIAGAAGKPYKTGKNLMISMG